MPRTPRVFVPGGIYHVASRGSDRRPLFLFDTDREEFLERLGQTVERHELSCLAYCLMGNHYHLIIQTPDARLSRALQELNSGYSRHFNRVYKHSAHLFRNRFLAQLVATEAHLLVACRYVAHNPVRAGLCGNPYDWPWSSCRANAGIDPPPHFLNETILRDASGHGSSWRTRFRDFVELSDAAKPPPGHKELPI
jgi:putative transposase